MTDETPTYAERRANYQTARDTVNRERGARAERSAHTEPCGCVYRQTDAPDDTGYGQGWLSVRKCNRHADPSSWRTPNGAPAAVHNG